MKVLDLQCELRHGFEGWFADEQAFIDQQSGGLIECPLCGSHTVQKMLSAPRLNLGATPPSASASVTAPADRSGSVNDLSSATAHWHAQARELVAQTENVGERFASEARAMHEGDLPPRAIRGVATAVEVRELVDDGITVLAVPSFLVEPLH